MIGDINYSLCLLLFFVFDVQIALLRIGMTDAGRGSLGNEALLTHDDGSSDEIVLNHTFNANQIDWFKAGSALNLVKSQQNLG